MHVVTHVHTETHHNTGGGDNWYVTLTSLIVQYQETPASWTSKQILLLLDSPTYMYMYMYNVYAFRFHKPKDTQGLCPSSSL